MINKFTFLLCSLFFPCLLFAQSNFKPGYIVNLKGDTLRGSVDYREWEITPKSFRFKNTDGSLTTYTPANAAAVGITGLEYFDKYILPISVDQVDLNKIGPGLDSTKVTDSVFLKVIIKGKYLTLYNYTDLLKPRFFISNKNSLEPRELTRHIYLNPEDHTKIISRNDYRNQLLQAAFTYGQNSDKLSELITNANYDEKGLSKIVSLINGDSNRKNAGGSAYTAGDNIDATGNKTGYRFFAGAAVSSGTLKYKGAIELANNPNSKASYFPQINFGFDSFLNSNTGQVILRGELNFSAASLQASSAKATQDITMISFGFTPQIIYNIYNAANLKIFFGAGVHIAANSYSKNTYTEITSNGASPITVTQDYPILRKFMVNIPIKAGVTLNNRIEIFGGITPANTLPANYVTFEGNYTEVRVGFNYLFGVKK